MADNDGGRTEKTRKQRGKDLINREDDRAQPLNPRIIKGLNNLYDGIVNDPLPDKITSILDQLREKERQLKAGEKTSTHSEKGADGDD